MSVEIIVALIASIGSLLGVIITVYFGNKKHAKQIQQRMQEQTELTLYRIKELEKKQDKHNSLIERTYKLEEQNTLQAEQIKVMNHRISDLEKADKK